MRVRALSATGDMTFGQSQLNYLINTPQAVAQSAQTRLLLFLGEWFLDSSQGTPWDTQVLGKYTQGLYDSVIQSRITQTAGCTGIVPGSYSSVLDTVKRTLTISCQINTQYGGPVPVSVTFQGSSS
jgi:hypothetical protein